jgi:hypothetical protein
MMKPVDDLSQITHGEGPPSVVQKRSSVLPDDANKQH